MPRPEKPLDPSAGPVAAFAHRLRQQRKEAGLTYRELAARTPYSHAHMVRAAGGDQLPSWLVVRAYLVACGVTHPPTVRLWEQVWIATNDVIRTEAGGGEGPGHGGDPRLSLRHITTSVGFGQHLHAFANRKKPNGLRKLAVITGIPRSTLADWFSGRRLPTDSRLYQFAVRLDATQLEQAELRQVRDRLETEQKMSHDLEHYTQRALEAMEAASPQARLQISNALLRAGEQRLRNDAKHSSWVTQTENDAPAQTGRHRAERLWVLREQTDRLITAQNRQAAAAANEEGPGVWGATVARRLHAVVHEVDFPQVPGTAEPVPDADGEPAADKVDPGKERSQ